MTSPTIDRHDPVTCTDCTPATASDGTTGAIAIGFRMCGAGRAETDAVYATARATNPDIAALHAMMAGRA